MEYLATQENSKYVLRQRFQEDFAETAQEISDCLKAGEPLPKGCRVIGHGQNNSAISIEDAFVLRIPNENVEESELRENVNARLETLPDITNATIIPRVEHLVGIDDETGQTITTFMPGSPVNSFGLTDATSLLHVSRYQIHRGLTSIVALKRNGYYRDAQYENVLYHPEHGFQFIDLGYPGFAETRSLEGDITSFFKAIQQMCIKPGLETRSESFRAAVGASIMNTMLDRVTQYDLPKWDNDAAYLDILGAIEKMRPVLRQYIEQYSDENVRKKLLEEQECLRSESLALGDINSLIK